MPRRYCLVIDEVIRGIERSVVGKRDAVRVLEATIRQFGDCGVDPYLLIAVLIEGTTRTLDNHIPAERQADTAKAVAKLLADRLKAQGYDNGREASNYAPRHGHDDLPGNPAEGRRRSRDDEGERSPAGHSRLPRRS